MLMPDFSEYSLALFEGNRLIYSSPDKGLRPLFDCLEKHKEKYRLVLHDKIIGLAAAKLVVYSKIISEVITMTASFPAKKFLEDNGIIITAGEVVANILKQDKSAICPGEVIALHSKTPDDFFRKIKAMFDGQVNISQIN